MSNSRYYRKQSEICRKLARLASDGEIRARLVEMANDYMRKAARAEAMEEARESIIGVCPTTSGAVGELG
jgi:hypothetical protein